VAACADGGVYTGYGSVTLSFEQLPEPLCSASCL
jgi:hypothetical protein